MAHTPDDASADQAYNITPLPSPSLNPPQIRVSRADVVREACSRVPQNNLGLPEGIHRSDLLVPFPPCLRKVIPQRELETLPSGLDLSGGKYTDEGPLLILDESIVRSAYLPLDYSEGFPTFPSTGQPFWAQLEFEPTHAFKTFEEYLKQGTDEGARRLYALSLRPDIQRRAAPEAQAHPKSGSGLPAPHNGNTVRPVHPHASDVLDVNPDTEYEQEKARAQQTNEQLKEWHTLYYWGPRARAYDLFYLDGIRQSQGMLALRLQNQHYTDAQTLYTKVMEFVNGENPEFQTPEGTSRFWAEMTPRVLVDFMKVLAQMSRVSLGLPGAAPAPIDSPTSAVGLLHSLLMGAPVTTRPGRGPLSSLAGNGGASGSEARVSPPEAINGGGRGPLNLLPMPNTEAKRGPGRPRSAPSLDDDTDKSHPSLAHGKPPSHSSFSQPLTQAPVRRGDPDVAQIGTPEDAERVRKIAMIFNIAKARKQAEARTQTPSHTGGDEE